MRQPVPGWASALAAALLSLMLINANKKDTTTNGNGTTAVNDREGLAGPWLVPLCPSTRRGRSGR